MKLILSVKNYSTLSCGDETGGFRALPPRGVRNVPVQRSQINSHPQSVTSLQGSALPNKLLSVNAELLGKTRQNESDVASVKRAQ